MAAKKKVVPIRMSEPRRRKLLTEIVATLGPLRQKAHAMGAHMTAKYLNECVNSCGWDLARWLEKSAHETEGDANG